MERRTQLGDVKKELTGFDGVSNLGNRKQGLRNSGVTDK